MPTDYTPQERAVSRVDVFGTHPAEEAARGANPPDNMYGGCSIQVFDSNTGANNLSNTHADANGFLNYVAQFDSLNFHFEDGGVEEWEYSPTYDDWQGKYGMDAVRVFYHSGHGGMNNNGVFFAPMGAQWDGQDWVYSNAMSLGDQFLRYLFWSTCNSVEVLGGQTPINTWNGANKGLRMIFGFQSTSVDSGDYGKNFWSHWNSGSSFSQAWQDASLQISTSQQVSSTACGATEAECQDRLWNERLFFGDSASNAWYWWRWAGNAPGAAPAAAHVAPPAEPRHLVLARRPITGSRARALLERYNLDGANVVRDGALTVRQGNAHFALLPDGSHQVRFAEPDRTAKLASFETLRAAADAALRGYKVGDGAELAFHRATATFHAGGPTGKTASEPAVADVTLHYRQVVENVPAVEGGEGFVRITLDPAGALVRIDDTTRSAMHAVRATPKRRLSDPEKVLRAGTQALLRRLAANGPLHHTVEVVPNTMEVGYRLSSQGGILVARCEVEVTSGQVRKRHVVEQAL
jgi:hypothetical protein